MQEYLCKKCKNDKLPPGLNAQPGTCTGCKKPHSTPPLHILCHDCCVACTFPRCGKCGTTIGGDETAAQ